MEDKVKESGSAKWKSSMDWVNLVLALWVTISPLIFTYAAGGSLAVILGIVLIVLELWALASPDAKIAQWIILVGEIILFFAPWLGGFASGGTGWNAWIISIIMIIITAQMLRKSAKK